MVAGANALVMSALGKSAANGLKIRDLLISTAVPVALRSFPGSATNALDTVAKQGAGLINVYNAVHRTTEAQPSFLALNDTGHAALQHTLEISNVGKVAQAYSLKHVPAATMLTMDTARKFWQQYPGRFDAASASVTFSPATLSLAPAEKKLVLVTFTPPSLNAASIPVYSGWLSIKSSNDADLGSVRVPYFGVAADLSKENVLDVAPDESGQTYPQLRDAAGSLVRNDSTAYSLKSVADVADAPSLAVRMRFGAKRLTVDLVQANTTFQPTYPISSSSSSQRLRSLDEGQLNPRGSTTAATAATPVAFDDFAIVGRVHEDSFLPRDTIDSSSSITLSTTVLGRDNKTAIAVVDGHYRFLLRVSKLWAEDLKLMDGYESYLSHAFEVKGSGK